MNSFAKKICLASAVISFLLCLTAGLWILLSVGFDTEDDAVWTGLGLYFVGKAFFVGPMLVAAGVTVPKG